MPGNSPLPDNRDEQKSFGPQDTNFSIANTDSGMRGRRRSEIQGDKLVAGDTKLGAYVKTVMCCARFLGIEIPNTDGPGELINDGGAFMDGQEEDEYENDPIIHTSPYYQRVRGDDGYYPPSKGFNEISRNKTKLWCAVIVDGLDEIDAVNCKFTVRLKMFLIWKLDLHSIPQLNKLDEDKTKAWMRMLKKAKQQGGPYKVEDDEWELFEDEVIYPQSLYIRNMISKEGDEDPEFLILDPGWTMDDQAPPVGVDPREWKPDASRKKGEIWMKAFDGLYTCREMQELQIFPFDVQDLSIQLGFNSRIDEDRFNLKLHTVEFARDLLDLVEWTVYPPESDRKGEHGSVVRLRVIRKSGYYLESVALTMLFLTIICVSAFAIPTVYESEDNDTQGDGVVDRLSITLTMMLTSVAFKFVISDSLPKISYFTFLDKYMFYHMAYMFCISMYFAIAPYVCNNLEEDTTAMYIFIGILCFIMFAWCFKAFILVKAVEFNMPPPVKCESDAISWCWQKVPHLVDPKKMHRKIPKRFWQQRKSILDLRKTLPVTLSREQSLMTPDTGAYSNKSPVNQGLLAAVGAVPNQSKMTPDSDPPAGIADGPVVVMPEDVTIENNQNDDDSDKAKSPSKI